MQSPRPQQQDVLPVAVWKAVPNQQYQITPHRKYYITTGSYAAGTVVDVTQLGKVAALDFTGKQENLATVTMNADYTYDVKYSFS
jgi:hypothetical protein